MGENTKIEWADNTFNPWIGCTRKSAGCLNCYAEYRMDTRLHQIQWGPKGERRVTSYAAWRAPLLWDKRAAATGRRESVFCASLADVFDDHPSIMPATRARLWELIARTQNLDWLLLTKRPENWPVFLPFAEPQAPFLNVRLGVSIEDQDAADERGEKLAFAAVMGWKTFVSYGPAIGPVDWEPLMEVGAIGWLVAEGESGANARMAKPAWFRAARDACAKWAVPFLMKQWGEWAPYDRGRLTSGIVDDPIQRFGKKLSGRLLDGVLHDEFPT